MSLQSRIKQLEKSVILKTPEPIDVFIRMACITIKVTRNEIHNRLMECILEEDRVTHTEFNKFLVDNPAWEHSRSYLLETLDKYNGWKD